VTGGFLTTDDLMKRVLLVSLCSAILVTCTVSVLTTDARAEKGGEVAKQPGAGHATLCGKV
jgi:hypothetical protein